MKIIKPLRLNIMSRPYYKKDNPYLGVSISMLVDIQDKPMLRPEPELWELAKNELACANGLIDLSYPKSYAEYLAVGYAYPHTYLSENVSYASISLGEKQKKLIISGDRQWQENKPSHPQPFNKIPIDWTRSYGGSLTSGNPLGIGEISNETPHIIPNIESPTEQLTSPSQKVTPAGFGPIDLTWPARQQYIGTLYNEEWVKKGALGFADDVDARLFNMAPSDQQWAELAELPSEMPYRIENMHPQHPVLEGILPSWKARCFAYHIKQGEEIFSEIEMRHTTVWFFPHLEKLLYVYHGECPIEEDDAFDVQMLMPALEKINEPRSLAHYRDVWLKRSDKEKGATYAYQEADLIPEDIIGAWIDTEQSLTKSNPLQQNMDTRRQSIYRNTEQSLQSVDSQLPQCMQDTPQIGEFKLSELPAFMAHMNEIGANARNDAKQQIKANVANSQKYATQRPVGPESFHTLCENVRKQQGGNIDADQQKNLYQVYRLSVQHQDRITPLSTSRKAQLRQWVISKLENSRDFTGCDLTGADLSHLDFTGANLTATMMESADLSYAIFDNCTLEQTLLARVDITSTSFRHSTFNEVTLAQSQFTHCDFTGATLIQSVIEETQFVDCYFTQARLSNQLFDKSLLVGCYLKSAALDNVIFNNETELKKCAFSLATFHKCSFINTALLNCEFKEAHLIRCSMVDSVADDIDFTQANLDSCAFAGSTSLERACFSYAQLTQCNLRKMPLKQANLSFAHLTQCDMSEALMQNSNLSHIQTSHAVFVRTNLEQANLEKANLMGSWLKKSRLIGCNFTKANLFRADISQAITDKTTSMENAFVKQMKIYPLSKGIA